MNCPHAELVPLYALESLDRHDARAFEEHLDYCTFCKAEVQSLTEIANFLALSAPIQTPSEAVRAKLMKIVNPSFERVLIRSEQNPWHSIDEGVSTRLLFQPVGSVMATLILKMKALSRVDLRVTNDPIQIYVLQGSVSIDGCVINAGDFLAVSGHTSYIRALSDTKMFLVGHKQMLNLQVAASDSLHDYCNEMLPHYVIEDLSMRDWRIVNEHLATSCKSCQERLQRLHAVTEALAFSVKPMEPSVETKAKLMDMTGSSRQRRADCLVKADEGEWERMLDGVYFKKLFLDKQRGLATSLYRLGPGAIIPTHSHTNIEECLVLEGSFRSSQQVYTAGDYMCMPPKTMHESFITPNGAVMLIVERRAA